MDPAIPSLLRATAITTLRYPGGGYADNYHWSTYKSTRWQAEEPPKYGYYAPDNDFGHFVSLIDKVGTAIITVNYGSNLTGTGPGEPAEAAAWVAYCNGSPDDTKIIGKDSTGTTGRQPASGRQFVPPRRSTRMMGSTSFEFPIPSRYTSGIGRSGMKCSAMDTTVIVTRAGTKRICTRPMHKTWARR